MKFMMAIAALMLITGCAPIAKIIAPPYIAQPIRVYKPDQYALDLTECMKAGDDYQPSFNSGSTATATVKGATSNSSLIPISPLVPAYGAAGALLQSLMDSLDVASGSHANVARNCLHDETMIDGSAVLVNPN